MSWQGVRPGGGGEGGTINGPTASVSDSMRVLKEDRNELIAT